MRNVPQSIGTSRMQVLLYQAWCPFSLLQPETGMSYRNPQNWTLLSQRQLQAQITDHFKDICCCHLDCLLIIYGRSTVYKMSLWPICILTANELRMHEATADCAACTCYIFFVFTKINLSQPQSLTHHCVCASRLTFIMPRSKLYDQKYRMEWESSLEFSGWLKWWCTGILSVL